MRNLFPSLAVLVCLTGPLAFAPTALASPAPAPGLPDLVEKVLPGVVNISSTTVTNTTVYGMDEFMRLWGIPQERKSSSLGSGFIIDKDGFILTNNHVVDHATEVEVTLLDKRRFRARIVGKDQKMDLALLQIRDEGKVPGSLTPVPLADSDKVRIAESVFAVGNPFGLQHTVTLGIVSAKNRTIGQGPFDNFLQTDASINPGNSGGPLFNLKGEVVGINTVIFSKVGQSGGVGFAIPANSARDIIGDLKRYGRVPRPWLGIVSEPMTPQIARTYDLGASEGILVYNIVESGPADRAGLQQGDIIVGINGAKVTEPNDAERALSKLKPTDTASLNIVRGKKKVEAKLHLQELPRMENLPQGII